MRFLIVKIVLAVVVVLVVVATARAQSDSVLSRKELRRAHWESHYVDYNDPESRFRPTQLIAPVVLIGGASLIFAVPKFRHTIDRNVRNRVELSCYPKEPVGDYLQYVPAVSSYILNVSGVRGRHSYLDATVILATSWLTMGIMVNVTKYSVGRLRPDGNGHNSFPSGHTATAFMGAEFLRREYWHTAPWIGLTGYLLATGVGVSRMCNNRHWVSDVIAGAGMGILSVQIAYWLFPPMQRAIYGVRRDGKPRRLAGTALAASPYYDGRSAGAAVSLTF